MQALRTPRGGARSIPLRYDAGGAHNSREAQHAAQVLYLELGRSHLDLSSIPTLRQQVGLQFFTSWSLVDVNSACALSAADLPLFYVLRLNHRICFLNCYTKQYILYVY